MWHVKSLGKYLSLEKSQFGIEINSTNFSSNNRRGSSLQILFEGGRFERSRSKRMAPCSDITILVYEHILTLGNSLLSNKK